MMEAHGAEAGRGSRHAARTHPQRRARILELRREIPPEEGPSPQTAAQRQV